MCSVGKILPGIQDVRNAREWVPTAREGPWGQTGVVHVPLNAFAMSPGAGTPFHGKFWDQDRAGGLESTLPWNSGLSPPDPQDLSLCGCRYYKLQRQAEVRAYVEVTQQCAAKAGVPAEPEWSTAVHP